MYSTVRATSDVDRLAVGTIGWDRYGAPVARDTEGWFVVGGSRIPDVGGRLPLALPAAYVPGTGECGSPCEVCLTVEQDDARPDPAEPGALVDRVAELIRAEFPDAHPHSRVNLLRSELCAARIVTFLASPTVGAEPTG